MAHAAAPDPSRPAGTENGALSPTNQSLPRGGAPCASTMEAVDTCPSTSPLAQDVRGSWNDLRRSVLPRRDVREMLNSAEQRETGRGESSAPNC